MKSTTLGIGLALAIIAIGASFNIESPWITAAHWVLAGAGLLCLAGILIAKGCERWEDVSQALDYRTANGFGIESQTRRLQANASRGLPPYKPASNRKTSPVTSLDKAYQATLTQARLSGEAAGVLQAQCGPDWPRPANPYKPGSRAHIVWLTSFEAVVEHKGAADAQHAHNQRSAA